MRRDSTGYGDGDRGEKPPPPPPSERKWEVVRPKEHYSEKDVVQVLLDGYPIGLLYLPDEEHIEWMRKKLNER